MSLAAVAALTAAVPVTTDRTADRQQVFAPVLVADPVQRIHLWVARSEFGYTGIENDLSVDPTAEYVRGPGGDVVGVNATGSGVYAWADLRTDVAGQFGATSASLTGSAAYRPFGEPLAGTGMLGSLGYQSEWTDTSTGRVNMHSRWYNPSTGGFDSRDTKDVSPVPNPMAANRYSYAGGNPLGHTDPSGHDFMEGCESVLGCFIQGFANEFDSSGCSRTSGTP